MKGYSLRRFIAIALISVILLSLAWDSVGKSYNALLVYTLSYFLPAGAQVQAQGHTIQMSAWRDGPPIMVKLERDGREFVVGHGNIHFTTPAAQDAWLKENPEASPTTYFQNLESRIAYYALIPALALMLAIPAITLRVRALCLVAVLSLGFCGHLAGMYLISERFVSWVNEVPGPTDPGRVNSLILSPFYAFLFFSPLLAWIPIMYFRFRADSTGQ